MSRPLVRHCQARLLTYILGPLCNTPVAIPPGEDPNIRMERHISMECSVMTGKSGKTRSQPVCARGKCGKVLYAPITCNVCPVLLSSECILTRPIGLQEAVLSPASFRKGPQLREPYVDRSFIFQFTQHVFAGKFQAFRKELRRADVECIKFSCTRSAFFVRDTDTFKYSCLEQAFLQD